MDSATFRQANILAGTYAKGLYDLGRAICLAGAYWPCMVAYEFHGAKREQERAERTQPAIPAPITSTPKIPARKARKPR